MDHKHYFNPRSRVGSDPGPASRLLARGISIHAPVWGATPPAPAGLCLPMISIHAPVWGATPIRVFIFSATTFQSTLPCGERRL